MTTHMQVLNAEIQSELTLPPRYVDPNFEMAQQIASERAAKATCCYGCKTGAKIGCYRNLRTTDAQWIQAI